MQNPRLKKAKRFLKDAETLFRNEGFDSCISRCYYAVYHGLTTLLEQHGIRSETWPHEFVLSEFGRLFVHRRKLFLQENINAAYAIRKKRSEADYGLDEISEKKAKRQLDKTKALCHTLFQEIEREKTSTA